jgi:hypothetical protein
VTRPNVFCCWICSGLLVTEAARSRPSFAVRWGTRGARHMILSVTVVASSSRRQRLGFWPGRNPAATRCLGVCPDVRRCPGLLSRSLSPARPAAPRTPRQSERQVRSPLWAGSAHYQAAAELVSSVTAPMTRAPAEGLEGCGCTSPDHCHGVDLVSTHECVYLISHRAGHGRGPGRNVRLIMAPIPPCDAPVTEVLTW